MGTTTVKKSPKKREYTDEERFALSLQSPAFVKKKKDAEAFLKKAGLPEWHPYYDKFKKER